MATDWKPLSVREGRRKDDYDGPFDGVPEWLFAELWGWIDAQYPVSQAGFPRPAAIGEYRAIASMLRLSLDSPADPILDSAMDLQRALYRVAQASPETLLDVADYWLRTADRERPGPAHHPHVYSLNAILASSGSIYRVMTDSTPPYLDRRVAPEIQQVVGQLSARGRAGEHVGLAWKALYGRKPDPSAGYREAIKAVEAAAIPIISPANDRATLGTVIADIRNAPDKWEVTLHSTTPEGQLPVIQGMLELLWNGQSDRHGTPDPNAPLSVTQEQAEAALHLALTLVQFFTAGAVRRK